MFNLNSPIVQNMLAQNGGSNPLNGLLRSNNVMGIGNEGYNESMVYYGSTPKVEHVCEPDTGNDTCYYNIQDPYIQQPYGQSYNPYIQQPYMEQYIQQQPYSQNYNPVVMQPYVQQPYGQSYNPYIQQPYMEQYNSMQPYVQQPYGQNYNPVVMQPYTQQSYNPYIQQPYMQSTPVYADGASQYTTYNPYNNYNTNYYEDHPTYQQMVDDRNNHINILKYISKKLHKDLSDEEIDNMYNPNNNMMNNNNNQLFRQRPMTKEEREEWEMDQLLNFPEYIKRNCVPSYYLTNMAIANQIRVHEEVTREFPIDMSIRDFEENSYKLMNEVNERELRTQRNKSDTLYDREKFGSMLRNMCRNDPNYKPYIKGTELDNIGYYSKDNPTRPIIEGAEFKNGRLEVHLPDRLKSEYTERRNNFFKMIFKDD